MSPEFPDGMYMDFDVHTTGGSGGGHFRSSQNGASEWCEILKPYAAGAGRCWTLLDVGA